jgi:hypothetical protein
MSDDKIEEMVGGGDLNLKMPLIQQYNRTVELSNSHVFKLRPEELR